MRQLLNGLSIKMQVLLPVLFSVVLLLAGVIIGGEKLEEAFQDVSTATDNLIVHKEELSDIVDNSYGMRIKAIYSLFNPEDIRTLMDVLNQKFQANNQLLNSLSTVDDCCKMKFGRPSQSDDTLCRLLSTYHAPSFENQAQ